MDLDDLKELSGELLSLPGRIPATAEQRPSLRKPRRSDAAILRMRVDLEHAKPPIWRRLDVRSDIGLDVFHQVLQGAFGWTDSHLHRFALGGSPFDRNTEQFLCPYDVEEGEDDGTPAKDVTLDETLSEPGDVLQYCYDYGDSWDLIIVLESVIPIVGSAPIAVCTDGRRGAPPEDCGGLRTAAELAEILEDPAQFDLDEINQALNDPYLQLRDKGADPRLVEILNRLRYTPFGENLVVRLMSLAQSRSEVSPAEKAAALHPFLWFLDHVGGDGLSLTSAGYLRPDDVTALAAVIPTMADWIGTANRESHTYPVLSFRESVQKLGLIRKYRGQAPAHEGRLVSPRQPRCALALHRGSAAHRQGRLHGRTGWPPDPRLRRHGSGCPSSARAHRGGTERSRMAAFRPVACQRRCRPMGDGGHCSRPREHHDRPS